MSKNINPESNASSIPEEELINLIKQTTLFSKLNKKQCKALIDLTEEFHLKQGKTLFEQDDYADAMYILVDGQLISSLTTDNEEKMICLVNVGETIGELGALSQKPRSLTVKATKNSSLLRLTRTNFITFWEKYSTTAFQLQIIDGIISRSQSVIKLLANEKLLKHVVLIPATDEPIPDEFIAQLKENKRADQKLLIVDSDFFIQQQLDRTHQTIKKIMSQADHEDRTIVFIIKDQQVLQNYILWYENPSVQLIFNNIDALYAIASINAKPELHGNAKQLFEDSLFHFATKKELILIHTDSSIEPLHKVSKWLNLYNFTLHHHIRISNPNDFKRLIRFFLDIPTALVLGGGGVKGWAELGVIKALEEQNIPIDAIGGTSIGSLIAAVYAQHQNYEQTYESLKPFLPLSYKNFSFKKLSYPIISLTNGKAYTEALQKTFANDHAEDLWLPNFSMITNLSNGQEIRKSNGLLWENIRCSSSLPLIFPPFVKNGQLLVDGGLLNNLPVDQMRNLIGKKSNVIAVLLSNCANDHHIYKFPPVIPFLTAFLVHFKITKDNYIYPPLFETFINSLLIGSKSKVNLNARNANILIKPELSDFSLMKLKPEKIDDLINLGYIAAMQKLNLN